jgi:steroid delta-isomerase-like uncharacterized protein
VTDLSTAGVIRTFFDALNARDFPRAAGAIAEDCEWESVATETVHRGPGPIIAGLREFVSAFPDWHVRVDRMTSVDTLAVIEWETTGTFEAPFRGELPNGKRFRRRGCAVADVHGGKIVHYRDYYDRATLLGQLGLMHLLKP